MARAGFLEENGLPDEEEIPGKVVDNALLPQSGLQYSEANQSNVEEYRPKSVEQVIDEERPPHLTAAYLTLVRNPDVDELWSFITEISYKAMVPVETT
jgi:mannitol-1-phosphate/altronate dehydrogenase